MSKRIITIARQSGSGGHEIGERLAKKLNIPLHDRNLVEKAVEELKLDKSESGSVDEKVLSDYISNFVTGYQGLFGMDRPYYMAEYGGTVSEQMYKTQSQIIRELADQGPCVIVGRCADYVLRKRDDVLSVFICADEDYRIERMMKVRDMNRERAAHTIKTTDKSRSTYYNVYTEKKWDASDNYDMILNVSRLGADAVVEILAKMYEAE